MTPADPVLGPRLRTAARRRRSARRSSGDPASTRATPAGALRSSTTIATRTCPTATPSRRLLAGPEQVFRLRLDRPVANFGVVISRVRRGVASSPGWSRPATRTGSTGYAALPFNLNPYLVDFGEPTSLGRRDRAGAGRLRHRLRQRDRAPGRARSRSGSGSNDTTPPTAHACSRASCAAGDPHPVPRERRRLGGRSPIARGDRRRQRAVTARRSRAGSPDPDQRLSAGRHRFASPGLRPPGDAQHGERRADPPEHARPRRLA